MSVLVAGCWLLLAGCWLCDERLRSVAFDQDGAAILGGWRHDDAVCDDAFVENRRRVHDHIVP
jgi:hypothetical protein